MHMATKTTGKRSESEGSSLESELRRIVKEGVAEAHDDGVSHGSSGRGGSGGSTLPLLFVAGALGVAALLLWRRSDSMQSGESAGIVERVRTTTEQAAERTGEMSGQAAQRVDESGETVAERTKELSEEAAQRVAEGGETVAERTDEASEEAADRVQEGGEEASSRMEDAAESGDEGGEAAESQ